MPKRVLERWGFKIKNEFHGTLFMGHPVMMHLFHLLRFSVGNTYYIFGTVYFKILYYADNRKPLRRLEIVK